MHRLLIVIFFYASIHQGCYQANTKQRAPGKKKHFVYRETIIKGSDTGMIVLGPFKRNNIADVLCQRWELENRADITADLIPDTELRKSIVREMALFKDSTVVLNPFGKLQPGKWRLDVEGKRKLLTLAFADNIKKQYVLENLTSRGLTLSLPEVPDFYLYFFASGELHQNMYNDPFHPINNQWRIRPLEKEPDSAIHQRLKNCLLFFAMYYRDHIKRKAETISFEGLPEIFTWYNRGIGLPDKEKLSESWVDCFYDKEQALKGYSILRKLIVDYEYRWPSGAPGWTYATHSVLEQMYHKMNTMKE